MTEEEEESQELLPKLGVCAPWEEKEESHELLPKPGVCVSWSWEEKMTKDGMKKGKMYLNKINLNIITYHLTH